MKKLAAVLFGAVLALAIAVPVSFAQPSATIQAQTPMTRNLPTLKVMTAQTAATVTSSDQSGFNISRVACVFNQASHTGSPSSTFTIQNKDAASGLYYNLVTSTAITADATPTALYAGAGVPATANVSAGLPLAQGWRVSITVGGTATPTVTGTVGCSVQ